MRILTLTNLYPNYIQPNRGIFIKYRMDAFCKISGAEMDVVSPVPYFPQLPFKTRWTQFSRIHKHEMFDGVNIYHPRYLVVPKIVMHTHCKTMFQAAFPLVQRLHEKNPYDLIDAHWVYPDGWAAVKIGKLLKIPVVVSARGNDINEYVDFPKILPLIKWTLQHSDCNIAVCQALKDIMLDLTKKEDNIHVIGNGVDRTRFQSKIKAECRKKLGLPADKKIILSVGLLEKRKGHHILIEALGQLRQSSGESPHLYIIGAGPLRQKMIEQINMLNLADSVKLVGEMPNAELANWYSASDLLCLASDREGWPNVLLEAIACGAPVLATPVYGVPEVIHSDSVGQMVAGRTPAAFAEKIPEMLAKKWDAQKMKDFAAQHSWESVAKKVQETFNFCLDQSRN